MSNLLTNWLLAVIDLFLFLLKLRNKITGVRLGILHEFCRAYRFGWHFDLAA